MKRFDLRFVYCGKPRIAAAAARGISGNAAVYIFMYFINYLLLFDWRSREN
jgi:hypothetical protein